MSNTLLVEAIRCDSLIIIEVKERMESRVHPEKERPASNAKAC